MPAARGRGTQLRAGCGAARGAWLLVLHADARVPGAALREAEAAIAEPGARWGSWPLAIDRAGPWMRVVEAGARLRWRLLGLCYGDQGLLVRRDLYDAAGGYPDQPLMEDVALVRALRRLASPRRFRTPIVADGRRWDREGAAWVPFRNLGLLAAYLLGVAPDRLAGWYRPHSAGR